MKTFTSFFCFLLISNLYAQKLDKTYSLNDEKIKVVGTINGEKEIVSTPGAVEKYAYQIAEGLFTVYDLQFLKGKITSITKKSVPVKDLDLTTANIGDLGNGFQLLTIMNSNNAMTAEHTTWSNTEDKLAFKSYNITYRVKNAEEGNKIIAELKEAQK